MPKVKEVAILNIDNVPYAVDTMSVDVQNLVTTFNEWNQTFANKQQEVQIFQVALESLQQQIIGQIKKERDAAAAEAATKEGETAPVAPADTTAKE